MFLEIPLLIAAGVSLVSGFGVLSAKSEYRRWPRPIYGATMAWWYGGFADETAAHTAAVLLDSDYNCDAWAETDGYGYGYGYEVFNESLGIEVTIASRGLATVRIKDAKKAWITVPMTAYDDYYLAKAYHRWKARKKEVDRVKKHREAANIIDHRVTQNYIKTIEMIEKRILNSGENAAPQLMASLPPPEMPVEEPLAREMINAIKAREYDDPVCMKADEKKRVRLATRK